VEEKEVKEEEEEEEQTRLPVPNLLKNPSYSGEHNFSDASFSLCACIGSQWRAGMVPYSIWSTQETNK
jgi:hypothetical protein